MRPRARLTILTVMLLAGAAVAQPISRSRAEVRAFHVEHPCPATGRIRGACPAWQVDHIKALCTGGEDRGENMHWLSAEDHRFKTQLDVRECRKLRKIANTPARATTQSAGPEKPKV
jgi:hypothetical protein